MKSSTALLGLALVAAALIGATRWLDSDASSAALAAAPRRTSQDAPAGPASAGPVAVDAPAGEAATREGEHRELVSQGATPTVETSRRAVRTLLIVDARTGEPIGGAEVRYESLEPGASEASHRATNPDTCDAWMREPGPRVLSADDGLAELDTELGRACVACIAHGELFARAAFQPDEQGVKSVELLPDGAVEVLVLGPDGAPAPKIEVALRSRMHQSIVDRRLTRTDGEGRARWPHVAFESVSGDPASSVAVVGLAAPGGEVPIDPLALPGEPVILRLGASGSVEVVARDLDGEPLKAGSVELSIDNSPDEAAPSFWRSSEYVSVGFTNGRALFEHVRLGEALIAKLEPPGAAGPIRRRLRGPRSAGERAVVEFKLGEDQPAVVVRLVDEAGAPLAERNVRWTVSVASQFSRSANDGELRTDSGGEIELLLDPKWPAGGQRTLRVVLDSDEPYPPQARLDLSRSFSPGRHELGELVLRSPPLIAAGRVVNADGAPAPDARVSVQELREQDEETLDVLDEEIGCDAEGRFVLRGELRATRINLRAQTKSARSAELSCAVGTDNLELTLVEGGVIAGRVLLDTPAGAAALSVTVKCDERSQRTTRDLEENGEFRFTHLDPGEWVLSIASKGFGDSNNVLELPGLHVPAGGECADPRLKEIDLRGRVATLILELAPPLPSDRVMGMVFITPRPRPSGTQQPPIQRIVMDRTLEVAADAESFDVRVVATGFRVAERKEVRGEVRIELERGPQIRLRAPAGFELPEPPYHLKPFLQEVGATVGIAGHFQNASLGADREVRVYAPGAGEYEVVWLLETRLESSMSTSPISVKTPQRVRVVESSVEQVIDLEPPLEEIAEALRTRD